MRFLQESKVTKRQATINVANNVLANLEGKALISGSRQMPFFISDDSRDAGRLIPLANGIFDWRLARIGHENYFLHHTTDFFSTNCLPFAYEPTAKCPTWLNFLSQMLPDEDVQAFLQEWFGYNLVPDTTQQTFVLCVGDGANGKTVVCCVLRALLGRGNVSAVGLEQFNPVRTFALASMIGKLANVVEEISETDRVAEGVLKDYVSGGLMTLEHKFGRSFEANAKARLTFATNVLPRFKDRSGGLWRRMMPIPFDVQIGDPARQDKRLADQTWWEGSGELPGILNWALVGLNRLTEQGSFTQPDACLSLRKDYRHESNPAESFLHDHCVARNLGSISSMELYTKYSNWMKQQNANPLGNAQFTREIKKTFKSARLSENAKSQSDGRRSRVWEGIELKDNFHQGEEDDFF
jgi:putative DNA primase/helicase